MTKERKMVTDYHYTECGLDNVLIRDMPIILDDDGDEILSIPAVNLLHALIMLELSEKNGSWSASELKFVRTELGLTQSQLGELVDKDRQTIARWEKDQSDIDKSSEMVIRMAAVDRLLDLEILELVKEPIPKRVPVMDMSARVRPNAANNQIVIQTTAHGYSRAAA